MHKTVEKMKTVRNQNLELKNLDYLMNKLWLERKVKNRTPPTPPTPPTPLTPPTPQKQDYEMAGWFGEMAELEILERVWDEVKLEVVEKAWKGTE